MRGNRRAILLACAAGFGTSLAGLRLAFAQEDRIGIVKAITGTVTINRNGSRWTVEAGEPVYRSDNVETAAESTASIVLLDGTRLSVGPQSDLWLDSFAFEPQNELLGLAIRLLRGTLLFVSGDIGRLAPETIQVETPTGTLGVRGTRFVVRTGE